MLAFLFPGQGAQYVGMGVSVVERSPQAADLFARARRALGFDLLRLCAEGPEVQLAATENTQPAVLVTGLACAAALAEHGVRPDVAAGLSLGEYAALVASGALEFEDAVSLVRRRGQVMQEAAAGRQTAMAAVIGLAADDLERLCQEHGHLGVVEPANYNGAGQIVIGGDARAVEAVVDAARAVGARRAVLLAVSAPFHTSIMAPAAERLAPILEAVPLRDARIPVISNVTAQPVQAAGDLRRLLIRQVAAPVQWEGTMHALARLGVRAFVEVGPGTTLSGLVRKTARGLVVSVQDAPSLEKAVAALAGAPRRSRSPGGAPQVGGA